MEHAKEATARQIKAYFSGATRWWPWVLIVIGVPLIAVVGVGLILIAIGIFALLRGPTAPISDKKVDLRHDAVLASHDFVARAIEMSGFEFEQFVRDPILLIGAARGRLAKGAFNGARFGDDDKLRVTPVLAAVILATDEQIGVYRAGVDLVTGNRINEEFREVFYQDVASVQIETDTKAIDFELLKKQVQGASTVLGMLAENRLKAQAEKSKKLNASAIVAEILQWEESRTYRLNFADGGNIELSLVDDLLSKEANKTCFLRKGDEAAQAMYAFRLFVRDKKRGFLRREVVEGPRRAASY